MKRRIHRISVIAGILFLFGLLVSTASAEVPIKISLLTSKTSYLPGESIHMQINVKNVSGQDVIAQEGFSAQDFYLKVTFTDPDGKPIFTKYKDVTYEGGPPYHSHGKEAALVETILAGVEIPQVLNDARAFYDLLKPGWYSAQVFVHLETYSMSSLDPATGKQIAFLQDQLTSGTIASNRVSFEIASGEPVVTSSIDVKVNLLEIGGGTSPGAKKSPIIGAYVCLYQKSSLPSAYEPFNWKFYENIWNEVPCKKSAVTNSQGIASFENVIEDDYITMTESNDVIVGSPIGADDLDWGTPQPIEKHLMVMKKANGKVNPGKTTKKKGSLLLITEPEYVIWDTQQELYPFVFETIDEWGVTTSVSPPEGFVADHDSLDAEVINEMEAVQFTITDVGSEWKETKVEYKIKHKGKSENVTSEIGIKLSDKLAKKLGKSKYGDTACTGVFKDGKKISDKCEVDDKDKDKDKDKD